MKVIKVEEILVDDDVYAALEREVKELNNLTTIEEIEKERERLKRGESG